MPKQDLIRLSQSHLNLLSVCPPMFQQVYLEGLNSLPEPEHQLRMQWGNRFHLLMQQRELSLPIESLLVNDAKLDLAFKELLKANPDLVTRDGEIWREAEHCRSISWNSFLLTVVYDLLILDEDRALILDWKTYRQPRHAKELMHNWQTRLYLYILAETSEYQPEQIQMVYWFVGSGKPQKVKFDYGQELHGQTQQDLASLLTNLKTWLNDYQQIQVNLPHRPNCQLSCPYYQRLFLNQETGDRDWSKLIDDIEEITI